MHMTNKPTCRMPHLSVSALLPVHTAARTQEVSRLARGSSAVAAVFCPRHALLSKSPLPSRQPAALFSMSSRGIPLCAELAPVARNIGASAVALDAATWSCHRRCAFR